MASWDPTRRVKSNAWREIKREKKNVSDQSQPPRLSQVTGLFDPVTKWSNFFKKSYSIGPELVVTKRQKCDKMTECLNH